MGLNNSEEVVVIGAGFSGLSAAAYLGSMGYKVRVIEKLGSPGGRARRFTTENGYSFDMGPSWYWMPEVYERFFSDFGTSVTDHYQLKLLDPGFEMIFRNNECIAVPADQEKLFELFESFEKGSAVRLTKFLAEAKYKYDKGMKNLVYQPGKSIREFAQIKLIGDVLRLQIFTSFSKHIRKYFKDPRILALMEFPVLFLGAMPEETPALYSLMNYSALEGKTWYPENGFYSVVNAMCNLCIRNGVTFHFNTPAEKIIIDNNKVTGVKAGGKIFNADAVIASADYHHVESELLPEKFRNYNEPYWNSRTLAPSALIFYLGVNKKLKKLKHHTLFFEEDLYAHSLEIYKSPSWPAKPLFYCCCASATDHNVAPAGHENLFLLMPLAPGIEDNGQLREKYYHLMMDRLEKHAGEPVLPFIDFKHSYCINDFKNDYNSYKGNAYGLANTLLQTAVLKPSVVNRKLPNLFYSGQLTVPGPGVPPALISGKIASGQLHEFLNKQKHEAVI